MRKFLAIIPLLVLMGTITELGADDRCRRDSRWNSSYNNWRRDDGWRYRNQYQNRAPGRDYNRDGVVSRREWNGSYRSFDRLDRNNDGVISRSDRMPSYSRYDRRW